MTNSHVKQSPFVGYAGFGGGAGALSYKSAATKTYVDDVFSTYLYSGNDTPRSITNSIDNSTEGGMVWFKPRGADTSSLFDTERGATKWLASSTNAVQATDTDSLTAFNDTGFSLGSGYTVAPVNGGGTTMSSWNFRKAPGFFDVVTYTGNSSNRTIAHSLGSVPGLILIKNIDAGAGWMVYHRSTGGGKYLHLNTNEAVKTHSSVWNDTAPTSSVFSLGTDGWVNNNGDDFVAYLFAGGDVAAGTSANIDITSKTVTNLGGNFDDAGGFPMSKMTDGTLETSNATNMSYVNASQNTPGNPNLDVYVDLDTPHVVTKYRIGPQGGNGTSGYNLVNDFNVYGTNDTSSWNFVAAFSPGQSGWTGGAYRDFEWSTEKSYRYWRIQVTQGDSGNNKSISEWKIEGYSAAANTDSYVFGEDEDKDIISCGGYTGNGSATGPPINCGWEPQYVIIKKTNDTANWMIFDSMRGVHTGSNDNALYADGVWAESDSTNWIQFTSTGFQPENAGNSDVNQNGYDYVYMAIRRPDGYVGKPAEAGTSVFAMDVGNSSATIPAFDSTFPVDFALSRAPGSSDNWYATSRLTGVESLAPNQTWVGSDVADFVDDSNVGWCKDRSSSYQSWMWKRGAGFDEVCWEGQGSLSMVIPHSLGTTPEMIWTKNRDDTDNWICYHKGLNGGTNPQNYFIKTNASDANIDDAGAWHDTAPTATDFTVGNADNMNYDGHSVIAMLFATVPGISKCGYHTCDAGNTTLTMDFQPRFLLLKNITSGSTPWVIIDSLRGINPGVGVNTPTINLSSNSQQSNYTWVNSISSTGLVITAGQGTRFSNDGDSFIWYAHA